MARGLHNTILGAHQQSPMTAIPERLLELLKEAPRNCWLVVDLAEMQILGCYEDLVQAVKGVAGVLRPLIIWSPEGGFDLPA